MGATAPFCPIFGTFWSLIFQNFHSSNLMAPMLARFPLIYFRLIGLLAVGIPTKEAIYSYILVLGCYNLLRRDEYRNMRGDGRAWSRRKVYQVVSHESLLFIEILSCGILDIKAIPCSLVPCRILDGRFSVFPSCTV